MRSCTAVLALALVLRGLSVAPAAERIVVLKATADTAAPGYPAEHAVDGDPETIWHTPFEKTNSPPPHWLEVDLGKSLEITGFSCLPRKGGGNGTIQDFAFYVSEERQREGEPVITGTFVQTNDWNKVTLPSPVKGRYARLKALREIKEGPWTSMAEFKIESPGVKFECESAWRLPFGGMPQTELEWQYAGLRQDLRQRERIASHAGQTWRREALILPEDRDPADIVARRVAALLKDLRSRADTGQLAKWEQERQSLKAQLERIPVEELEARYRLYEEFCALRRKAAFANPLLDFSEILFLKRHRSLFNHMCDQYYGMAARPGGGLYVLSGAFASNPAVRDVLADARVASGRLAGKKLSGGPNEAYQLAFDGEGNLNGDATEGGSFLSPELSYDTETILFSYVECDGDRRHLSHTDPTRGHWPEGRAYHIFQVNRDGTGLRQLTDGGWNDFSPIWLPNGRIAFISERRGGYLRCGRTCPTYTLFDMAADGGDINCLSLHETNEWDPSVTHDGRIIWTRWDYVDRHGCTAHMPWITTLDGRDPRPLHGNYAPRKSRPDMEVNVRAIPGSSKFSATAAPHHGQAFGALVLIDPSVPDDDAMAPVKRLTPEVDFPESQGGGERYGMAWPLSEDYFLCVYDLRMPNVDYSNQHLRQYTNNYGLYLVDAFGNKELVYRDPRISCASPIPVRRRPTPPVENLAAGASRVNPAAQAAYATAAEEASVTVINVYDSRLPFPAEAKIKAIRVLQVLPMTTPSGAPPHETGHRIAGAGDSVVPVRHVLGTAPVEEDGSARFIVPAHRELFFQALDERGLAVQSMRSATALRAGEQLTCQGCHSPSYQSAVQPGRVPLALQKPAARLKPEVDGANPFSYPRLVQPVLDRHCLSCHDGETPPNLAREPYSKNWFASYANLTPKFGFINYGGDHRTIPGQFGARASKLLPLLEKGHYDVKLSEEDFHRLALWLDCCSMFYGVYEKDRGQAQLRGEVAWPTLE